MLQVKKGKDLKNEWEKFIFSEDDHAFYALYNHYFKYLSFIGLKKGFSTNKVKDAINDLFLYLLESRGNLASVAHFHNYILTCFLRKLYQKAKLDVDQSVLLEECLELYVQPSAETLFIQLDVQENVKRILMNFVDQLPTKQRQMIFQKFYLDLSYKEISDVNNVSINTVYNTIYKSVDRLKQQIGDEQLSALAIALAVLSLLCFIFFHKQ